MCGEAREQKPSKKESVMGVKQYKPTSPGRRFQTVSDFAEITTSKPEKSLLAPLHKKAGRNNKGRITVRHQGGGNKRRYRIIDFKRNKDGVPAKVATVEYDPNRSARIALLHYVDGEKRYILHPKGLKVGDMVVSGPEADIKPGNALPLANIPVGTLIHAVELQPGKGAALARSAGTSIQLMGKEGKYAILRMPSSEMRRVLLTCRATVGEVGNAEHANIRIGKAGRLWAVNPENGFFGVAPGTSMKSNPNALISTHKDTIFTNVALDLSDNTVWWEGMDKNPPKNAENWKGEKWDCTDGSKGAHPNSRFTAPAKNCPCISSEFDSGKGVPISAIVFGVLLVLGIACSYAYKKLSARHETRAKAQENKAQENEKKEGK